MSKKGDIISRAEEFFYFEDDLSEKIETWASERCSLFASVDGEHPLSHQMLFQEYCELFEALMEGFITNEGISTTDFYSAVRAQMKQRNASETFSSVLLGCIDFECFCQLMIDVKLGRGVVFCPPLVSSDMYDSHAMAKDEMKSDSAFHKSFENEFQDDSKSSWNPHK